MFVVKTEDDSYSGPTMDELEEYGKQNGYVLWPKVWQDSGRREGGPHRVGKIGILLSWINPAFNAVTVEKWVIYPGNAGVNTKCSGILPREQNRSVV